MPQDTLQTIVDGTTVERVLLDGDLQKLTASQRVSYYAKVCESLGLNPLTRPFEYITLNGKLTLYARREATEQLRKIHNVSITIVARELVDDCYAVTARAILPDGRTDESIGVKSLANLKGDARANAMMTGETKAKRRVTLSIVGLGMLDETEVADIPAPAKAAKAIPPPVLEAPPPAPSEPGLPDGYVRIVRIDQEPTRNENVTKFAITLSTGEQVTTINSWLSSLAQQYCEDRTPVRIKTRRSKWGTDLLALMTADEADTKPEPLPLTDDIPF